MSLSFEQAVTHFTVNKFYRVEHKVVLHHMRKDFADREVTRDAFFIMPVGPDYLHVAIVEYEFGLGITDNNGVVKHAVAIHYTCAGDDLLYGLRRKYTHGNTVDNTTSVVEIAYWASAASLREHPGYIRARFRHTRVKATTRALFVMVKDIWRSLWS